MVLKVMNMKVLIAPVEKFWLIDWLFGLYCHKIYIQRKAAYPRRFSSEESIIAEIPGNNSQIISDGALLLQCVPISAS